MHLKDGTPARPGDIIKTPSGSVGLIIGGHAGSTSCNLHIVAFQDASASYSPGLTFANAMRDANGKITERTAVSVVQQSCVTAGECERIGHIDIGNG